jgi:hypothetical protein
MDKTWSTIIAVAVGLLLGFSAGLTTTNALAPDIPRCQEDQVLVGVGYFDEGLWSDYACGPAVDDIVIKALPRFLEKSTPEPEPTPEIQPTWIPAGGKIRSPQMPK